MIKLTHKILAKDRQNQTIDGELHLPIDLRIKSRAKANLQDGREAGWQLDRGEILRGGDLLQSEDGTTILMVAAKENVSRVATDNSHLLLQAAYHLGNRHVPIEIASEYIAYRHDHVLDDMLQGLGLQLSVGQYPFEPEAGAYQQMGAHGHHHHHD